MSQLIKYTSTKLFNILEIYRKHHNNRWGEERSRKKKIFNTKGNYFEIENAYSVIFNSVITYLYHNVQHLIFIKQYITKTNVKNVNIIKKIYNPVFNCIENWRKRWNQRWKN